MVVKHNPPGTPLPDNHPFKGGLIIFGAKRPSSSAKPSTPAAKAPPPPIQDFDPPPLPEWDGPVEVVFSISEESRAGGASGCWIERRGDDYILFGNELGPMSEPCSCATSTLIRENPEFGMEFIEIESSLAPDDFRDVCDHIILSNVTALTVNGVEIKARDIDSIMAQYKPKSKRKRRVRK